MRLSVTDIAHVFGNFLGLKPSFLPNGTFLFTVDKDRCRRSLGLDKDERRTTLHQNLKSTNWDINTTNLSRRRKEHFRVNEILAKVDDESLDRFMDVFLAGITTIPYFKAPIMNGDYHLEGGYMDNTPLRRMFEDPEVDEIIAVDFTNYDYAAELEKIYATYSITLPFNSIDMFLLVSDIELTLPNIAVLENAQRINQLLKATKRKTIDLEGKRYWHKPIHILKPANLEAMTVSFKHRAIQKEYFEQGQHEMASLFEAAGLGEPYKLSPARRNRNGAAEASRRDPRQPGG